MNRNIKLSLLALAAVLLSSCSDFLSVDQKGRATIPSFLGDPSGLKAGLVGAYNEMYAYLDNEFTKYGDVAGNMVSMPAGASDMIDQYNYTSDASQETGAVGYIWRKIYVAQANVNNIIQYAPTVKADYPENAALCDSILGHACLMPFRPVPRLCPALQLYLRRLPSRRTCADDNAGSRRQCVAPFGEGGL